MTIDWLTQTFSDKTELSILGMYARMAIALIFGFIVAAIYRFVRPGKHAASTFPATLVLLAVLCAMLPLIIGQNVAWAFGLVGALSIVKFRTVLEDTADITFVIFAVLVGMAVGAGRLPIAAIGIVVVGVAALSIRPKSPAIPLEDLDSKLSLRIATGRNADSIVQVAFEKYVERIQFLSGETARQGQAFDFCYGIRLRSSVSPTEFLSELNRIDEIQNVELRRL